MKYLIYTATIYVNYVFSPVLALTGQRHEIDSGDSTWALTVGVVFILSMFISLKSLITRKVLFYGKNIIFYPVLFFLFAFLIESAFFPVKVNGNYSVSKWYILSTLYLWPAVFIAIDIATEKSLLEIYKWVDALAMLISLGMIPTLMSLEIGKRMDMAGDNYQAVSYMGAFAVGILLYGMISPYQECRFAFFRFKTYKIISSVFILIDVAAIFISGGRGGALLLFLNVIICLFAFNKNWKAVLVKVVLASFALLIFILVFGKFLAAYGLDVFFDMGIDRTFSYISGGGIDMSEASDRDEVYKVALNNIFENPILGQGVFRTMSMYGGYPHNLFLEILVDGGLVYLIFWIFYLIHFFKRLFKTIKEDSSKSFLLILTALPFLSLLFSGTYTSDSYLWFVVAYIFVSEKVNMKVKRYELS